MLLLSCYSKLAWSLFAVVERVACQWLKLLVEWRADQKRGHAEKRARDLHKRDTLRLEIGLFVDPSRYTPPGETNDPNPNHKAIERNQPLAR